MINFFLKYKKLVLLIFLCLFIIVSNQYGLIPFSSFAVKTEWFVGSIFKWVSFVATDIYNLPNRYDESVRRGIEENQQRMHNAYYRNILDENQRLRKLLNMPARKKFKAIGAEVLMSGITSNSRSIFIGCGTDDGVKRGDAVVFEDLIVGKIVKAGSNVSLVYLITHPDIGVDVLIGEKKVRGVFRGGVKSTVEYVDVEKKVSKGDLIYSSGRGGVYPPGFKVGVIEKVSSEKKSVFHDIEASPLLDVSKIDYVFVIPSVSLPFIDEASEER